MVRRPGRYGVMPRQDNNRLTKLALMLRQRLSLCVLLRVQVLLVSLIREKAKFTFRPRQKGNILWRRARLGLSSLILLITGLRSEFTTELVGGMASEEKFHLATSKPGFGPRCLDLPGLLHFSLQM